MDSQEPTACPRCGVTDLTLPCLSVMGDKPGTPLPYRHAGRLAAEQRSLFGGPT